MSFARGLVSFAIALLIIPSVSFAGITTLHLTSEEDLQVLLADDLYVSEGRIGDREGSTTYELAVGDDFGLPAVTADYGWENDLVEVFTISYDAGTGMMTFTLGGVTISHASVWFDYDELFILAEAADEGTEVVVYDLNLDGVSVADQAQASEGGFDILWIQGADLDDGFTLMGHMMFHWSGKPPTQSRLRWRVRAGRCGPVSTQESSWSDIKKEFGGN